MNSWRKTNHRSLRTHRRAHTRRRALRLENLEQRPLLVAHLITSLYNHCACDETSGDVAADVAGGATGTLLNWQAGEPKWAGGKIRGALALTTRGGAGGELAAR